MEMWEILVPATHNNGSSFSKEHHQIWDGKVRGISGGLTILSPAKGFWLSPDGKCFAEKMIPVRLIATRDQINEIVNMTGKYYEQECILAYRISDMIILKHFPND